VRARRLAWWAVGLADYASGSDRADPDPALAILSTEAERRGVPEDEVARAAAVLLGALGVHLRLRTDFDDPEALAALVAGVIVHATATHLIDGVAAPAVPPIDVRPTTRALPTVVAVLTSAVTDGDPAAWLDAHGGPVEHELLALIDTLRAVARYIDSTYQRPGLARDLLARLL
jgi:hypothetical protein